MIIYISNQNNHGIGHTKKPLHARGKILGVHIGAHHSDVYLLILAVISLESDSIFSSIHCTSGP